MENLVKTIAFHAASATEVIAVLVIASAVLHGLMQTVIRRRKSVASKGPELTTRIRIRLGHWLSVSLEFLLAADILRTAVAPTWDEIGKLGAIIILRTGLNYFLEREMRTEAAGRAVAAE